MIAVARPAGPAPMMVAASARDAETDMRGAGRHRRLCRCCGSSAAARIGVKKNSLAPAGWNVSAGSSTLGSGGPAGAADARLSRHEPHSSHDRLRGAAWSRRRTAGTRAELLTPPFGARRTHRPQGEQHRSDRRALVVSVDTAVHRALDVASRPFEPAPHLPPAWHPSAAPLESCSLPAAVRRLAGALALRDVDAPPVCCGLHPRRSRVEGARRRRGWHRASPPSGGACWAWLACACGARSRRSAGAHCAAPPEHGRTSTCGASRSSSHRGQRWRHSLASCVSVGRESAYRCVSLPVCQLIVCVSLSVRSPP